MVMLKMRGVFKVRAKGKTYYYAWRGGPRIEGDPGTPEFIRSWEEAKSPTARLDRSKFATWIALYKASGEFRDLAPRTKSEWLPWLDRVKDEFGALRVRQFDRPEIRYDIRRWRDRWRDKPRTADYAKQVLSRVLSFAAANGAIRGNPCEFVENLYSANRADIIWTEEDLNALRAAASPEIWHAAMLAAYSGLRAGDLLRLSWSHIGGRAIELQTGKSRGKRTVLVPITAALRAVLDGIPKRSTTVLTNSSGAPWQSGFTSSWRKAVIKAGLHERDLHFHDLRGTAATNFYKADLTRREIAQILGWSEDQVQRLLDRYVHRDELLRDRIRRIEEAESRAKKAILKEPQAPPTPPTPLKLDSVQVAKGVRERAIEIYESGKSSVYFIRAVHTSRVKIGFSRFVLPRLHALATSASDTLVLEAVIPGTRALEKRLHRALNDLRCKGEWFQDGPELAAIINLANRQSDGEVESWLRNRSEPKKVTNVVRFR